MQHAGVTGDSGLGAERHAHEVAEAVTAETDAKQWIGPATSRKEVVESAERNYAQFDTSLQGQTGQWKVGRDVLVGNQGRTVTMKDNSQDAYADPALIVEAIGSCARSSQAWNFIPVPLGPAAKRPTAVASSRR